MNIFGAYVRLLVLVGAGFLGVSEILGSHCLTGTEKRAINHEIYARLPKISLGDIGEIAQKYGVGLSGGRGSIAQFLMGTLGQMGLKYMKKRGERGMREEDDALRTLIDRLIKERGKRLSRKDITDYLGKYGYPYTDENILGIVTRLGRENDVKLINNGMKKRVQNGNIRKNKTNPGTKAILNVLKMIVALQKDERFVADWQAMSGRFDDISEYYTGPASFENDPLPELWKGMEYGK